MTDAVQIALIVGLTTSVPAILTTVVTFINSAAIRRAERHIAASKTDIASTKSAIITLEKNTNSIKDALVRVTGESEHAKGKLEGAAEATVAATTALPATVKRQELEG